MIAARMIRGVVIASAALALSGVAVAGSASRAGSAEAQGQEAVTFTKHVAPILQQKCQVCHQPNSIAPMSLLTYDGREEVRERHQGEGRGPADAAVAHRQDHRHSASSRTTAA